MKKVLIMLSTYNGNKYLREQLDSLYRQENVDIHILVRDDGSFDKTLEILSEYQIQYGKMTICAESNIGPAESFHRLMAYASDNFIDFDYYSFCDQDDVWMSSKLYNAAQRLEGKDNALYYCNALIMDSDLNIVGERGVKQDVSLQYVIFRQPALGCTQVMTKLFFMTCAKLSRLYLESNPPSVVMHDAFIIWISRMIKTEVVVDDSIFILYRQHGGNVTLHNDANIKNKILRVKKRIKQQRGNKYTNLQILNKLLRGELTENAIDVFRRMTNYQTSFLKTLSFAWYMQCYYSDVGTKLLVLYSIIRRLF